MPLTGKNILFVEDDPVSLEALTEMGKALGAEHVMTAKSGAEAIRVLQYEAVDVVVTDLHMRGGSGPELIEMIRAGEGGDDQKNCPVLVLTGDVRSNVKQQMLELGATGLVLKPVRVGELQDAIRTALGGGH